MLRFAWIAGLVACSGSAADDTPDAAPPACHGTHFDAAATSWALPGTATFDRLADFTSSGRTYATLDLDADGNLDLVVTFTSYTAHDDVGTTHWLVYRGGDAGFGAAESWSLPTGTFEKLADFTSSGRSYATFDVDGDRRPDLVVTQTKYSASDGVGKTHWLVYANTGSGFAATATEWALPASTYGFAQVADSTTSGRNYQTMDLDSDHRPDLVVSATTYSHSDSVGTTHWLVYKNTGSGFAAEATSWTLPSSQYGFEKIADSTDSGRVYQTVDLDGDGKPELVISAAGYGFPGEVGATHWLVYANTGTGFASATTSWTLPLAQAGYEALAASDTSGRNYATVDLDGDHRPDLVLTQTKYGASDGIGKTHWSVFANTGSGFATTAIDWPLPPDSHTFPSLGETDETNGRAYAVLDADGDARGDLVVTSTSYNHSDGLGTTHWSIFRNACD